MRSPAKHAVSRSRLARAARLALAFALGLAAVLVAAYLLRWQLFGGTVRERVERALGGALGAKASIGSISGSIVTSLDMRDLSFEPASGSLLARPGRIRRVAVEYRPWDGLRSIEIEGIELALISGAARPGAKPASSPDEVVEDILAGLSRLRACPLASAQGLKLSIDDVEFTVSTLMIRPGELPGAPTRLNALITTDASELARLLAGEENAPELTGQLTATVEAEVSTGGGSASVRFRSQPLSLADEELGTAEGDLRLSWPGRRSRATLAAGLKLDSPRAVGELHAELPLGRASDDGGVRVSCRLEVRDVPGMLPMSKGDRARLAELWTDVRLQFALSGRANSPDGWGELLIFKTGAHESGALRIPLSYSAGVLTAARSEAVTPYGKVAVEGAIPLVLAFAPVPSAGTGEGEISLSAEYSAGDVAVLRPLMSSDLAALDPHGALKVVARLAGEAESLVPTVRAELSGGSLKPAWPAPMVEDISVAVCMEGGDAIFESISARTGGGLCRGSGRMNILGDRKCSFHLSGRNALLVGRDDCSVRVRADFDVELSGGDEGFMLRGSLVVPTALVYSEFPVGGGKPPEDINEIVKSLRLELPLAEHGGVLVPGIQGLDSLRLDLAVKTRGHARVANSVIGSSISCDLRLSGNAAEPVVSGAAAAERGEIRAYSGVFLPIRRLRLEIPPGAGAEPSIDFESDLRCGLTKVNMRATGPLAAPTLTLSSEPPYPQEDLLALVVFGTPPGAVSNTGGALAPSAERLMRGLFLDHFPRPEPEESFLSRFALSAGAESQVADMNEPLRQYGVPNRGLVVRTEFSVADSAAVVTERDDLGDVRTDLRIRHAWPRPERARADGAAAERVLPKDCCKVIGANAVRLDVILRALGPQLELLGGDGWTEAHLSDASYRITRLYDDFGYPFARVSSRVAEGGIAEFEIMEGAFAKTWSVSFDGNKAFSEEELRESLVSEMPGGIGSPFSRRLYASQVDSILSLYRRKGYLDAAVVAPRLDFSPEQKRMNVAFFIAEGTRYKLTGIEFAGVPKDEVEPLRLLAERRKAKPLSGDVPDAVAREVLDRFRAQGRPGTRVSVETRLDRQRGAGSLLVTVRPGPKVRIVGMSVEGNTKTTSSYVRRKLDIEPKGLLMLSELRGPERRLIESGLFRSVRIDPVPVERSPSGEEAGEDEALVRLVVHVEEMPHLEASVRGGYGTTDHARGGMEVVNRNAFGHGETLRLAGEVSEVAYRAEAEMSVPWSIKRALSFDLGSLAERREMEDFELDYLGASSAIVWRVTPGDEIRMGLRYDDMSASHLSAGVTPSDVPDLVNVVPFLSYVRDRRNSRSNPRHGYMLSVGGEATGDNWGSDLSYWRLSAHASEYYPWDKNVTFALSARAGIIRPYGETQDIPLVLRYYGGGVGSVRGIRERELGPVVADKHVGGEVLLVLQAEIRFRLWRDLYAAAFADRGEIFATTKDVDLEDMRHSIGWGIRYRTPAGFLALDTGYVQDPRDGDPDSVTYFLFGLPF